MTLARIRTIKPEFWTDGAMIRLPIEVRLFYIGLWNFACDRGHLEDDPLGLKLRILPADPVDSDSLVQQLVDAGRLRRATASGKAYLEIPSFADHQRVDTRWKSRCLMCAQPDSVELDETHASFDETRGSEHEMPRRRGGEGKGKEGRGGTQAPPPPTTRTCRKHDHWGHNENCRACKQDREAYEADKQTLDADARRFARRQKQFCPHGLPRHEACERCGDEWPGN
ncbi:hypothetical protein PQI23_13740 [Leucobacter sp. USCH14]|uniref:hypothetical protein n=1 Tax=Leucobacter sp. USCH14 TaxID=3024838 RepID=UPI0030A02A85